MPSTTRIVTTGAETGFCAALVQAVLGEALNERLLPGERRADVASRLVERANERFRLGLSEPFDFFAAASFHFGYGAFWGALHALGRERIGVPPVASAAALTGLIYALAFSRVGGGPNVGSEPRPRRRTRGELAFQLSVAGGFAASLALLYEWARR